ncbi:tagatose-bisphosphate aldolase [Escherichia coli]|uniref:Tagatose-bisphosphate aldolase n=1 Tax=Escherichia coli TaxID=562 RepID=A0A377DBH3_ECOLX|nr:tagatose-bisphosphate aldolase [Escherichia coli]
MPSLLSTFITLKLLQVVVESAAQLRSPVMLAGTPGTYRYGGVGSLISLVQSLAREYNLPLVLHLDHHEESDDIFNKVRAGIRSEPPRESWRLNFLRKR